MTKRCPKGLLMLSGLFVLFIGCAPQNYASFEYAPSSGFTREVDESSTRGQITRVTPPDMNISWSFSLSPDGKSVVFSGSQTKSNDHFQLYRLDIGSQAPVKITAGGTEDVWDPTFSADGNYIIYRTGSTFWKIRRDGSGARMRIPGSGTNNDYYPEVSSADRIAFITSTVNYAMQNTHLIWTAGLEGTEMTQYREGNHPRWSPDGSKLVFEFNNDLWLMDATGTNLTQLTITENISEALPSFSPDGSKIVYSSNEGPNQTVSSDVNIWHMRIDGTGKTQVTDLPSWDSWPRWGQDGIYFLSGRGKGNNNTVSIWRIKM
jgi:Tol biopolymer transport system component